jgi:WD40 repeat protein
VLSWSDDGTARLWDLEQPDAALLTFRHGNGVLGASFSPSELGILTWSADATTRVWDASTGNILLVLRHDVPVLGASFYANEQAVLTWSDDGTVRLWNERNEILRTFTHARGTCGAAVNSDELEVLTWSDDGTARLWGGEQGIPLKFFARDPSASSDDQQSAPTLASASWSADKQQVVTRSGDNTAQLWNLTQPGPVRTFEHEGPVNAALFSSSASIILTCSQDGTARLWELKNDAAPKTFRHEGPVLGGVFNRADSRVLTWGEDKSVRLWDVERDDAPLQTFLHEISVRGAVFNENETQVLTWGNDPQARVWDVSSQQVIATVEQRTTIEEGRQPVGGALFSCADNSRLLTWAGNKAVLWQWQDLRVIKTFRHAATVRGALFNRDESLLITWSDDRTARLWDNDPEKSQPLQTFSHSAAVAGMVFIGDESLLLSWSYDGKLWLWAPERHKPIRVFRHYAQILGAMPAGPWELDSGPVDESFVATWCADASSWVWWIPVLDGSIESAQVERLHCEVLSAATIDENGVFRLLKTDEWLAKREELEAVLSKRQDEAD